MDDPNNNKGNSSSYDPSSSSLLSQPFLSKPSITTTTTTTTYPPIEDHDSNQDSDTNQQYIHISYNHGPRYFKDLPFLILFLLFVLSTFAFGIFSIFHRNTNYSTLSSYTYDTNTTSCINNHPSLSSTFPINFLSSSSPFLKDLTWTLVITFILSLPMCWFLLLLLKHYTKHLVYASLPFFILIPIFLNVYWFVACTIKTSCSDAFSMVYRNMVLVFVFLVIGVIVWILVLNWHSVEYGFVSGASLFDFWDSWVPA
jgi:hypothetical protein